MLKQEMKSEVLVLRLDDPAKLNAWSQAVRGEIAAALRAAEQDAGVKAVVVTGTGEKSFCAGADLSDPTMGDASAAAMRMAAFHDFYLALMSFPKPLVAALNGFALGSAFQAILLMDCRIGHEGVKFGLPEINSGMPCITGAAILSWSVGPVLTRSIATSGRFVGADEAFRHGLVDELVPPGEVFDRALAVARELAAKAPHAFAETKLWIRDLNLPALEDAFARAALVRGKTSVAQDVQAGIRQFFTRHERPAGADGTRGDQP